jgi:hypothetical protein
MPRIELVIGPMHGDHPKPNAAPGDQRQRCAVFAELGGTVSPGTATARR